MGKIEARPDGGAAGSVDRGNIVMHLRVRVERKPVADKREPVGEIESAEAGARVFRAGFDRAIRSGKTEETIQKGMEGDWLVALAPPDYRALEPHFQVPSWTES